MTAKNIVNKDVELCIKYDSYVLEYNSDIYRTDKTTEIDKLKEYMKMCIDKNLRINQLQVQKYNILVSMDFLLTAIKNAFGKSKNKYYKQRIRALKEGKTILYYHLNKDVDTDFISELSKVVMELDKWI
jgi:hypothetical protein